jgi:hypothetical protein
MCELNATFEMRSSAFRKQRSLGISEAFLMQSEGQQNAPKSAKVNKSAEKRPGT